MITETIAEEIIETLVDLMQLDIDAVEAYEQALKNIKTPDVYNQVESFKNDHKRHIDDLSMLIQESGDEPPERTKDLKGFIIKGMTAIRSMMGETAALKAMRSNEELTNKTYAQALKQELSPAARRVVEKNYEDEKRHLAYFTWLLESIKK